MFLTMNDILAPFELKVGAAWRILLTIPFCLWKMHAHGEGGLTPVKPNFWGLGFQSSSRHPHSVCISILLPDLCSSITICVQKTIVSTSPGPVGSTHRSGQAENVSLICWQKSDQSMIACCNKYKYQCMSLKGEEKYITSNLGRRKLCSASFGSSLSCPFIFQEFHKKSSYALEQFICYLNKFFSWFYSSPSFLRKISWKGSSFPYKTLSERAANLKFCAFPLKTICEPSCPLGRHDFHLQKQIKVAGSQLQAH